LLAKGLSNQKYIQLFLVVLAISTGVATLVPSPLSGGVTVSASEPQIKSTDWIVEHRSDYVVGSDQTFLTIEARYNDSVSVRLSGNDSTVGTWDQRFHNSFYSWGVTNVPAGSLHVVDDLEVAFAERAAVEGNPLWIRCYNMFKTSENKIYHGDDSEFYTISGSKETCVQRLGLQENNDTK
jgi:hypothetical protein